VNDLLTGDAEGGVSPRMTASRVQTLNRPARSGAAAPLWADTREDEGEHAEEGRFLFRALFQDTPLAMALLGLGGRLTWANDALCALLRASEQELRGTTVLFPEDESLSEQLVRLIAGRIPNIRFERVLEASDGSPVHGRISATAIRDGRGSCRLLAVTVADTTAEMKATAALEEAQARVRSLFENAIEGMFEATPEGRYLDVNPALARMMGYATPAELTAAVNAVGHQHYVDADRHHEIANQLSLKGAVEDFISAVRRADGSAVWISENVRAVRDRKGKTMRLEGTVEDVSGRKRAEEQIAHGSLHDRLTSLPNRGLFLDRVAHAINRSHRRNLFQYALLFINCDRFKVINDGLGHTVGDLLLREVAHRIAGCVRGSDTLARLGGDEFAILAEDLEGPEDAVRLSDRVQKALAVPLKIDGQDLYVSVSIGIAVGGPAYRDPNEILRDADVAMFEAKNQGRGRVVVFEPGMAVAAASRLQVENDLRKALERGEFCVHYQPIVNLDNGTLMGFEALVRWQHPERGLVMPANFIPTAEDSGMIASIGEWVLEESCRQVRSWKRGERRPEVALSVNLSPAQLREPDIVDRVKDILKRTGFDPRQLKLEITESAIIQNPVAAKATLNALKGLGIQLSIDDFGTGYSSLSHLHNFPIDTIKIDRSFVAPMDDAGDHTEIVR
jgi:diguanylate cyclase (GGDEF)-like protein/PAS domain S-box-containing protein